MHTVVSTLQTVAHACMCVFMYDQMYIQGFVISTIWHIIYVNAA